MYLKSNKALEILALYLSDYNKQIYLREISKLARIPLKTTQTLIANLERDKLLKSAVKGKNKYFRLNLDNIETKFYLLQSELHMTLMFIEKYPLFKSFMGKININAPMVVFGSFAKFKADGGSDLDLLVISKSKINLPLHLLAYKIHEIYLDEDSFRKSLEKKEALIMEIKDNHIILNNHSFFVNSMLDYHEKQ